MISFQPMFGLTFSLPLNQQESQMTIYTDSLLKMECHPGGDWNPGWGVVPKLTRGLANLIH